MGTIELKAAQKRRSQAVRAFGELIVKKDRILNLRNQTSERANQLFEIVALMECCVVTISEAERDINIAKEGIALATEANKHLVARENANSRAREQGRL